MANNTLPAGEFRLRHLLHMAAIAGETACVSQGDVPAAQQIMQDTGRRVDLFVLDQAKKPLPLPSKP
jgi:hypothetical protein